MARNLLLEYKVLYLTQHNNDMLFVHVELACRVLLHTNEQVSSSVNFLFQIILGEPLVVSHATILCRSSSDTGFFIG
jgi:hypothetical protein